MKTTPSTMFCLGALFLVSACSTTQTETISEARSGNANFAVAKSADYTLSNVSRRNFDKGFGVTFSGGTVPAAGTGRFACEVGFKSAPQNNGLSRNQINAIADQPERIQLIKRIFGILFNIDSFSIVTVQGYKGYRMNVQPKSGPGAANAKGELLIVETPKGRVSQVCVTSRSIFADALPRFRALTRNITLPQ